MAWTKFFHFRGSWLSYSACIQIISARTKYNDGPIRAEQTWPYFAISHESKYEAKLNQHQGAQCSPYFHVKKSLFFHFRGSWLNYYAWYCKFWTSWLPLKCMSGFGIPNNSRICLNNSRIASNENCKKKAK